MFTGIVEAIGEVLGVETHERSARVLVACGAVADGVQLGDSIAVNGACLTASSVDGESLGFDAVRETLERTNLGDLVEGSKVNLERALRVDARLDGHIVQGHVDGVGSVASVSKQGSDVRLLVDCEPDIAALLVDKGSVAINGVSLTVVEATASGFDVVLIPHTLQGTTLGDAAPGDRVNLEADILGKYVRRYLERVSGVL